jgi:hypothetical protein
MNDYSTKLEGNIGATNVFGAKITESNGTTAFNLTGCTAEFTVRKTKKPTVNFITKTTSGGITITNAANGELQIKLNPADTDTLEKEKITLWWVLTVFDAGGNEQVVDKGLLVLEP